MFCEKCGKELDEGKKFCGYCGAEISKNILAQKTVKDARANIVNNHNNTEKGIVTIIGVISFILIMIWIIYGFATLKSDIDAYDWVGTGFAALGHIMHWIIVLIFCTLPGKAFSCAKNGFVDRGRNPNYYGIMIVVAASIYLLLGVVFNDWSNSDISIVMFRVFGIYRTASVWSIILGILIAILGKLFIAKRIRSNGIR